MRTLESLICLSTVIWSPVLLHEQPPVVHLRSYPFFDEPIKPNRLHRHFNLGYLDADHPISSIDDLHGINSEEIGSPRRENRPQQSSAVWNVDDVKTLAAPKVLPDIVLDQENQQDGVPRPKQRDVVLDESEQEMGRFVVVDTPPVRRPRPVQQNYRRPPSSLSASSLMFDTVIATSETPPDFMEELRRIKLAQAQQQVEDSSGETRTQHGYHDDYDVGEESLEEPPQIAHFPPQIGQSSPQIALGPPEVTPYNPSVNVDQFEEILRRYLETNPQFLEQYMKGAGGLESKTSSGGIGESSTPLPEEIEYISEPTDIEEDSDEKITASESDISDEEFISTTEIVTPEPVTEQKTDVPEISVEPLPEIPDGNELKQEMKNTTRNMEKKTKRKRKKNVATTKMSNDL